MGSIRYPILGKLWDQILRPQVQLRLCLFGMTSAKGTIREAFGTLSGSKRLSCRFEVQCFEVPQGLLMDSLCQQPSWNYPQPGTAGFWSNVVIARVDGFHPERKHRPVRGIFNSVAPICWTYLGADVGRWVVASARGHPSSGRDEQNIR